MVNDNEAQTLLMCTQIQVSASTDAATADIPVNTSYVASPTANFIYRADAGTGSVSLGGVSSGGADSGNVTIGYTGVDNPINLLQTTLIMNYCIALEGLFPSRN